MLETQSHFHLSSRDGQMAELDVDFEVEEDGEMAQTALLVRLCRG